MLLLPKGVTGAWPRGASRRMSVGWAGWSRHAGGGAGGDRRGCLLIAPISQEGRKKEKLSKS